MCSDFGSVVDCVAGREQRLTGLGMPGADGQRPGISLFTTWRALLAMSFVNIAAG